MSDVYRITSPKTGKIYKLRLDAPPTQADEESILAQMEGAPKISRRLAGERPPIERDPTVKPYQARQKAKAAAFMKDADERIAIDRRRRGLQPNATVSPKYLMPYRPAVMNAAPPKEPSLLGKIVAALNPQLNITPDLVDEGLGKVLGVASDVNRQLQRFNLAAAFARGAGQASDGLISRGHSSGQDILDFIAGAGEQIIGSRPMVMSEELSRMNPDVNPLLQFGVGIAADQTLLDLALPGAFHAAKGFRGARPAAEAMTRSPGVLPPRTSASAIPIPPTGPLSDIMSASEEFASRIPRGTMPSTAETRFLEGQARPNLFGSTTRMLPPISGAKRSVGTVLPPRIVFKTQEAITQAAIDNPEFLRAYDVRNARMNPNTGTFTVTKLPMSVQMQNARNRFFALSKEAGYGLYAKNGAAIRQAVTDELGLKKPIKSINDLSPAQMHQVSDIFEKRIVDARAVEPDVMDQMQKSIAALEGKPHLTTWQEKRAALRSAYENEIARRVENPELYAGFNPFSDPTLTYAAKVAATYIEEGATTFAQFARRMVLEFKDQLSPEQYRLVELHLKDLYEHAKRTGATPVAQQVADKLVTRPGITLLDVWNLQREMMTWGDMSGTLRQGSVLNIARPGLTRRMLDTQAKAMFGRKGVESGEAFFARRMAELQSDPRVASLIERSGVDIQEVGDLAPKAKKAEEYYSSLGTRIPVIGKGIQRSELAFVGGLNDLRVGTLVDMADGLNRGWVKAIGLGGKVTDADLKAIGNFINVATGRGGGSMADTMAKFNNFGFAPRNLLSRFQFIIGQPLIYAMLQGSPRVAAMIAADYAKYVVSIVGLIKLAEGAGAKVSWDPRSSDFAQIRIGNTRFDLLAGFKSPLVLASQLLSGKKVRIDGNIIDLRHPKYGEQTGFDVVQQFLVGKMHPSASFIANRFNQNASGEDMNIATGQPTSLGNDLWRAMVPLIASNIADSIKEGSLVTGLTIGSEFFGVGANTYESESRSERKPRSERQPREQRQ